MGILKRGASMPTAGPNSGFPKKAKKEDAPAPAPAAGPSRRPSLAERMTRLRDEMPRLPVAWQQEAVRIMEAEGACSWASNGTAVVVDLSKADGETLDMLDWIVEEYWACLSGASAAKQGK